MKWYKNCFKGTEVDVINPLDYANVVKRLIRMVKEGFRCLAVVLPFKRIPSAIVRRLIDVVMRNLNQFLVKMALWQSAALWL